MCELVVCCVCQFDKAILIFWLKYFHSVVCLPRKKTGDNGENISVQSLLLLPCIYFISAFCEAGAPVFGHVFVPITPSKKLKWRRIFGNMEKACFIQWRLKWYQQITASNWSLTSSAHKLEPHQRSNSPLFSCSGADILFITGWVCVWMGPVMRCRGEKCRMKLGQEIKSVGNKTYKKALRIIGQIKLTKRKPVLV